MKTKTGTRASLAAVFLTGLALPFLAVWTPAKASGSCDMSGDASWSFVGVNGSFSVTVDAATGRSTSGNEPDATELPLLLINGDGERITVEATSGSELEYSGSFLGSIPSSCATACQDRKCDHTNYACTPDNGAGMTCSVNGDTCTEGSCGGGASCSGGSCAIDVGFVSKQ